MALLILLMMPPLPPLTLNRPRAVMMQSTLTVTNNTSRTARLHRLFAEYKSHTRNANATNLYIITSEFFVSISLGCEQSEIHYVILSRECDIISSPPVSIWLIWDHVGRSTWRWTLTLSHTHTWRTHFLLIWQVWIFIPDCAWSIVFINDTPLLPEEAGCKFARQVDDKWICPTFLSPSYNHIY